MNEMSKASAIRPAWADEYPEFSERLSAGNGRNLFEDHAYIHLLLEQTLRNKCKSTIVSSEYLFNLFHENKTLFLEKLDEFTELGFKKITPEVRGICTIY
jgi:hypothetical protein